MTTLVLVAVLTPALGTAIAARFARPGAVARACVAATAAATLAAVALLGITGAAGHGTPSGVADPAPALAVGIDRPSAVLLVAVTAIALVVASFSTRSLDSDHHRYRTYFVLLAAVTTGSALVVVPGGPIPLLVGWLLSGRALVALTRGWLDRTDARASHRRLVSSVWVGDLALVAAVGVGVAVVGPGFTSGGPDVAAQLAATTIPGGDAATLVAVLVVLAGAARSALVPFHRWLTATLYAPTPVSALVHAGFVSGAGLLLIRFAPIYVRSGVAVALTIALATTTIVIGSIASLTRVDTKGTLAWSTVAQMAFMVLQASVGAFGAAVFHIVGHGMYKAASFLGVGDTVSAALRSRRRPVTAPGLAGTPRISATVVIATAAVAVGILVGPEGLEPDERVLLVVFAWFAVSSGVHGILRTRSLGAAAALAVASIGAVAVAVGYFAAIDVVERFLEPAFADTDVAVDGAVMVVVVAALAALAGVSVMPGALGDAWRARLRWWVAGLAAVRRPLDLAAAGGAGPGEGPTALGVGDDPGTEDPVTGARLQAQVARAAELTAPLWPLASFVAVNPLGGLEAKEFEDAAADARRWLHGRTHRSLHQFRADHERGLTTDADLESSARELATDACELPSIGARGRSAEAIDVVLADLLVGPEYEADAVARTTLERRVGADAGDALGIDELISDWLAAHVGRSPWPIEAGASSFTAAARRQAIRHARRRLGTRAVTWLESLGDDPTDVLDASLRQAGVRPNDRVDEIRGHLAALPGWTGLARWRSEWAHPGERMTPLKPIEIAAVRAMLETAVLVGLGAVPDRHAAPAAAADGPATTDDRAARVGAVIDHLGLPDQTDVRDEVAAVLDLLPDPIRAAIWQRAQELRYRTGLLALLDRADRPADAGRPDTQVAFCIDVRSEGLRRHLEAQGHDETLGFAGFFGVPLAVRELGWTEPEARCPVLVAPSASAVEQPTVDRIPDAARRLGRSGLSGTAVMAHAATKRVPGAAFTTAESLGWILGPMAAWRTLVRPRPRPPAPTDVTSIAISADTGIDQRIFAAESVLRTMSLTEGFADLVVLCGHTSATVNNAHVTSLECGACAGAGGASNARAVASLLNEADVRAGLAARGIEVPDETWFIGAVHDTAADFVTILDRHLAPATHLGAIEALQRRLDRAGELRSGERAGQLPGARSSDDVQTRGRDWAEVRPEWGLATNAAFVIGPRSSTEGLDLGGRAFLHDYEPAADPDGSVLETIMTAPLVVGHWISAQYYFSTVDPERFGAGDKLLHNPIGSIGVVSGAGGDLRVGLPAQSTHVADRAHHQPLRLLAVVQADPTVVESIITRNDVLARLVRGSWLHVVAAAAPGEPWYARSPDGTWSRATDHADRGFTAN